MKSAPDPSRRVFTRRALVMMGLQTAVIGALGERLYRLQVEDGPRYKTLAEQNWLSTRLLAPLRGRITDRNGATLAGNRITWRALLMAEQTSDVTLTLDRFSVIMSLDRRERVRIERDIRRQRGFIPVVLDDFLTWEEMVRLEVAAPDLPGVLIDVGSTRSYPQAELLAHVVGYVAPPAEADLARDPLLALPGMRVGRAGLEQAHDADLRGRSGSVQMEVNSVGRVMAEVNRHDGLQGIEIGLSIDLALQQSVLRHLDGQSASAVVMNCRNGELLAMVSNPSFDPSLFDSGVSQAQWSQWVADPRTPLVDKSAAGLYPPGSTFKPAVALAALQAGTLTPSDRITCPGHLDVGGTRFHCWRKGGHGTLDLRGAIKHSCDVFFYEVARRTGMERIATTSHQLGLGTMLEIELPHAQAGLIPTPRWLRARGRHWNGGDTIVSGIGQGYVQVTPLQLATYASRIASGRAVQPHLTRASGGVLGAAASPANWPDLGLPVVQLDVIRAGMFAVVNEPGGTAPKARLPLTSVLMAGKTGSSQVHRVSRALREGGHFNSAKLPWEMRPHALFICFAPYEVPQYAAAIVIEHGNAGADVAAPIARDIMIDVLARDPANRRGGPGQRVADAG